MINPAFLKTFISLVETKSFTGTATKLHMTQPGVSQHIKWLEDYFAVPLIRRDGKNFDLTDQGIKVLAYGKALFADHDAFKDGLGTDDPHRGLCRFASPGGFGIKMYTFLLALNKKYPDLVMSYPYAPNPTVVKDVLEDRIDIGFVTRKPDDPTLHIEHFDDEKLCLIVPAKFSDFSFDGLMKLGFINHPDGFHHASRLLQENFPKEFRGMNEFPIRGFTNQITRIPEPVSAGLGFATLPYEAYLAYSGKPQPRLFPLKKQVTDAVYKISKKRKVLPQRFEFILNEYKAYKKTLKA